MNKAVFFTSSVTFQDILTEETLCDEDEGATRILKYLWRMRILLKMFHIH